MDYIHKHKVAHRDLKPENLLFDEENNLKICDLGLSNMLRDGATLRTSCGSPNYAAPEIISGSSYDGAEVDMWSCGVILYAMLTASLPFEDESMPSLFQMIEKAKYKLPFYLSAEVKDLINQLLQPLPMRRMKIADVKKHPWFCQRIPSYVQNLLDCKCSQWLMA